MLRAPLAGRPGLHNAVRAGLLSTAVGGAAMRLQRIRKLVAELHSSLDKALELISTVPASVAALDSSLVQALEAENARRQQKQDRQDEQAAHVEETKSLVESRQQDRPR